MSRERERTNVSYWMSVPIRQLSECASEKKMPDELRTRGMVIARYPDIYFQSVSIRYDSVGGESRKRVLVEPIGTCGRCTTNRRISYVDPVRASTANLLHHRTVLLCL